MEELTAGRGQVVIVTGEAGIGKSRLIGGVASVLGKDVRYLEGRSYAGDTGVPYGPFADLSRRYAGITDEDSEVARPVAPAPGPASGAAGRRWRPMRWSAACWACAWTRR